MKLVVFSDMHLHPWSDMAKIDDHGYNTRLVESAAILDRIVNQMDYDLLLFCGDMFHDGKNIQPRTLKLFREAMGCGCLHNVSQRLFIPGQHDYCDATNFSALTALSDGMFRLFEMPSNLHVEDVNFIFCPHYRSTERQIDALDDCKIFFDDSMKNIFVGHFLVKELMEENRDPVIPPNAVSVEDLPDYDFAFMGDYHPHVNLESEAIVSVGSVQHHSFNDKNRPQGGVVVMDTDLMSIQFIEIEAPMFVDVSQEDLGKRFKERPKDYYRVNVESDKEAKDIRAKYGDNIRFDYSGATTPKALSEGREGMSYSTSPRELVQQYCKRHDPDMVDMGLDILQEVGIENK